MKKDSMYLCIDLKSFYASVECVERELDPLTTDLVVADPERTEKTICLAVSPSLKAKGVHNRCRVFEIPKGMEYIMAQPRMKLYIEYSANIYGIYLKYVSKEDIHVYSIDEAFLDVTNYLEMYQTDARTLGKRIMQDILKTTGITATCGIGTNLYLAKIALDITAKHAKDYIGYLDEELFKKTLWQHLPLTDFWRIGRGTVKRLESVGIRTMKDIAKADEEVLYKLFGIDAELMIDHANGIEPTTIADIKRYKSKSNSLSSGQLLAREYSVEECRVIIKEMTDLMCLDLVDKGLVVQNVSLMVGYGGQYQAEPSNGSINAPSYTSSARTLVPLMEGLFLKIANPMYGIRRVSMSFNQVQDEMYQQYDLFCSPEELEKEKNVQKAVLEIQNRFGKNAILRGMNLQKESTVVERNGQIAL